MKKLGIVAFAVVLSAACSYTKGPVEPSRSVTISPNPLTIPSGTVFQLRVEGPVDGPVDWTYEESVFDKVDKSAGTSAIFTPKQGVKGTYQITFHWANYGARTATVTFQ